MVCVGKVFLNVCLLLLMLAVVSSEIETPDEGELASEDEVFESLREAERAADEAEKLKKAQYEAEEAARKAEAAKLEAEAAHEQVHEEEDALDEAEEEEEAESAQEELEEATKIAKEVEDREAELRREAERAAAEEEAAKQKLKAEEAAKAAAEIAAAEEEAAKQKLKAEEAAKAAAEIAAADMAEELTDTLHECRRLDILCKIHRRFQTRRKSKNLDDVPGGGTIRNQLKRFSSFFGRYYSDDAERRKNQIFATIAGAVFATAILLLT